VIGEVWWEISILNKGISLKVTKLDHVVDREK